jgi:hypothetical protein
VFQLPTRDLLVLLRQDYLSEHAILHEVEILNKILHISESREQFCLAHELLDRNRIRSNPKRILNAASYEELKPFRFLINKN